MAPTKANDQIPARTRASVRLAVAVLISSAGLLAVPEAQAIGVAATDHISQGAINGDGNHPASLLGASSDGSRVFFVSAEQLASTDADTNLDVYLREGSTTTQVSQGEINGSGAFVASFVGTSSDGLRVFFESAEQLASTDSDTSSDLYLREGSTTTHLSEGAINGDGGFHALFDGASSDGSRVIFRSLEPLASTDTDSSTDLYLREGSTTTQVSLGEIGGNGAFAASFAGASSDGSRVFFESDEPLASTDTDSSQDLYLREGTTTTHLSQGQINGDDAFDASFVGASSDGLRVFFYSTEQLASTDTDSSRDLYLREGGTTTHLSQGATNGNGAFTATFAGASSDGLRVFFFTGEKLASTDTDDSDDVYLREGTTTTHLSQGATNGNDDFDAEFEGASSDGSRVIFTSDEQLAGTDTDTEQDLYLRQGSTTTHLSRGAINGNSAFTASFDDVSDDGSRVLFHSSEQLASTDTDTSSDLYLREGSATAQVSQGAINGDGAFPATFAGASDDSSRVLFTSLESLAGTDNDTAFDLFAATIDSTDSTPPQTTIDTGPTEGSTTNDPSPTFAFSSDEPPSSFQCRLYVTATSPPAFTACSGPGDAHTPTAALTDGSYSFEVAATDAANNTDQTPATRSFTIDTTTISPDTEITAAKLDGKKVQEQGKKIKITLQASAGEPVELLAKGKVELKGELKAVKLKAQRKTAVAGQPLKLVLKPATDKGQRKILAALDAGNKASAKVTVRFTDAAGNERVLKATIKLR
jgi:hypothetical protein